MYTVLNSETNESFQVDNKFVEYSSFYTHMLEDLGDDNEEPLPFPISDKIKINIFERLYNIYCSFQSLELFDQPYLDYVSNNYKKFLNDYSHANKKIPYNDEIIELFTTYTWKELCECMNICDFFDMPMLEKMIGLGIATIINNKEDPDEIKYILSQIKIYL
jgi:hypothetical protein